MQENHYYFWIDFFSAIFPLLFCFFPLSNPVYKKWKAILPAIIIPGILFLFWDNLYTGLGVWNFNPRYLIGIYFFNLPIEEVLWFFCIPYACIFSYVAVRHFLKKDIVGKNQIYISVVLVTGLLLIACFNIERIYTSVTFLLLAAFLSWVQWSWKPNFLGRFYVAFLFILIPFFIVNGLLTGTALDEAIVRYDDKENLGIRMGTIPVEDTFYGMLLILMNISLFEFLQKRKASEKF